MRFGTSICLKNDVLDSEMEHSPLSLRSQFDSLGSPKTKGIPLGVCFARISEKLLRVATVSKKIFGHGRRKTSKRGWVGVSPGLACKAGEAERRGPLLH